MTIDPRIRAIHEAAHVVAAHVLGVPSAYATLEAEGDMAAHTKWLGPKRALPDHPAPFPFLLDPDTRADLERCAIAVLAGAEAVDLFLPHSGHGPGTARGLGPDWTRGETEAEESNHDDDRADDLSYRLAGAEWEPYRAWLSAVARRICRDESDAIRRVADALLEHGRLEGADLHDLVVGPIPTPANEETQTDD